MPSPRPLIAVLFASTAAVCLPAVAHAADEPAGTVAPSQDVSRYLQGIRSATTATQATAAYVGGRQIAPQSTELRSAMVHRLVELGSPELAETQAKELLAHDPSDGYAHVVLASVAASRKQLPTAVKEIAIAVERLPDDPIVQARAASILAAYDAGAAGSAASASAGEAAARLHSKLDDKPAFRDAYARARGGPGERAVAPSEAERKLLQTSGARGLPAEGWSDKGTASQQAPAAAAATNNPPPSSTGTYTGTGGYPTAPTYTDSPGYYNDGYRNYDTYGGPYYGPYSTGGYVQPSVAPALPVPADTNTQPARDPREPYVASPPQLSNRPESGPLQRNQVQPPKGAVPGVDNPMGTNPSDDKNGEARPAANRSAPAQPPAVRREVQPPAPSKPGPNKGPQAPGTGRLNAPSSPAPSSGGGNSGGSSAGGSGNGGHGSSGGGGSSSSSTGGGGQAAGDNSGSEASGGAKGGK